MGALDFFRNKLVDYCSHRKSFKRETISEILWLDSGSLILQSEVRGLSGSSAASTIYDRLLSSFHPEGHEVAAIEI
jgi:hypothetical protein